MNRIVCACIAALCFVLLMVSFTAAQSPNTGSMIVTVVDPNGALVPGAKISVINESTDNAREATSNSDGVATFPGLSLNGAYTVSVTATGFTPKSVANLTLRAGETANLKFTLPVGMVTRKKLGRTS